MISRMDKLNKSIEELWNLVNSPTISRKEEIEVYAEINMLEAIKREMMNKMNEKNSYALDGISQYGSYFTS
jgi:predicted transcriptional regulator